MTITLKLSPEAEHRLRERAAQRGQSLETYLKQLIEYSLTGGNGAGTDRSPEQWVADWRAWAASHRAFPVIADDSRESIYAGRDE